MSHYCLHVHVTLNVTPDEWLAACEQALPHMLAIPGLVWKLWLLDRERNKAGGVYLFRNEKVARAYATGAFVQQMQSSPAVGDLRLEIHPVLDALSIRTFGLPTRDVKAEVSLHDG